MFLESSLVLNNTTLLKPLFTSCVFLSGEELTEDALGKANVLRAALGQDGRTRQNEPH